MIPTPTATGTHRDDDDQHEQEQLTVAEDLWNTYCEIITNTMNRNRPMFLKNNNKKLNSDQLEQVESYLLQRNEETTTLDTTAGNWTQAQCEYATRCLTYATDFCAKRQLPTVCLIAWKKIRPLVYRQHVRENTLSTFMYALSMELPALCNDDEDLLLQQACEEAATLHDELYEPNEKTVTLRINSFIRAGDAAAAEELLRSLPDKNTSSGGGDDDDAVKWKRLRTVKPILQYYCSQQHDITAALRLFRDMRASESIHLDADTYALIIGASGERGCFAAAAAANADDNESTETTGPFLFDDLSHAMAEDLLELNESSAKKIYESLLNGFAAGPADTAKTGTSGEDLVPWTSVADSRGEPRLLLGRVSVDHETAVCPGTGAKLRLFALTDRQRKEVHDTLLKMAALTHAEHADKLKARGRRNVATQGGDYALTELSKFSDWLRQRNGEPYTAIVDGPNVAFFGHGNFHYSQVQLIVDKLESMGERPLVTMPQRYLASSFWLTRAGYTQEISDREMEVMNDLLQSEKMYAVPTACLDDYYWMLASVADQTDRHHELHVPTEDKEGRLPGLRPMLVTNDQMRDHKLALLEARLFRRWTSCHIVNYDITPYAEDEWEPREVDLVPADFFSREIQAAKTDRFGESTVWHFPVSEWSDSDRLCVTIVH